MTRSITLGRTSRFRSVWLVLLSIVIVLLLALALGAARMRSSRAAGDARQGVASASGPSRPAATGADAGGTDAGGTDAPRATPGTSDVTATSAATYEAAAARARAAGPVDTRAVVRRDTFGVPHIRAESEEAAAFAHGYVTAEDHGAALARLFLRASGALASVFGEAFVEEDLRTRMLGIHDEAVARVDELPPHMRRILHGYAAGYNHYLERHREELPPWATPVTAVDVLALSRGTLLLEFALNLSAWRQAPPSGIGSNTWAVGRPRSKSGHGMLVANPHLPWEGATIFHEVHLTVPGTINISGAAPIGVPVVCIGYNQSLGWSHTVNRIDGDDIYELTLDESRTKYSYDGAWRPLTARTISIDVQTDGGRKTQTRTALFSHYGPIIRTVGDKAYAFKSANLGIVNFLTQWNAMGKATSWRAFRGAVNMQQLPMFNLVYADRAGNIWYVYNGRIPIRPGGYDWAGVVPGNTSRTEWSAIHPLGSLPQILNPRTGYVQNCNDPPWLTNLEQPIAAAAYADYVKDEGLGWRSQEILRMLSTSRRLTLEQLMRFKFDSSLPFAARAKEELVTLVKARNNPAWREAADMLEQWNGEADADSRGATFFLLWWESYSTTVGRPFRTPWSAADPAATPAGLTDPAIALDVFERTIGRMTEQFGGVAHRWGDTHRLRRGNLDLPLGGTPSTLQNINYRRAQGGALEAVGGDSYVLAVEFGAHAPRAYSIVSYSQSSKPDSPHFADQTRLYANEQFKPSWFTERDIAAHLERTYRPAQ